MISSVSGVSFRGEAPKTTGAQKDIQELINRQGKYTKTEETPVVEEKKKSSTMAKVGKVVLGLAVALGVIVGANKLGFKPKELEEGAGWVKKGLNKVAEGCEWVTKHTWDALVNVFKKGKGKAEDLADDVAGAAGDAADDAAGAAGAAS